MRDNENRLSGVIFPLTVKNFELLKSRKKPVYIKYAAQVNLIPKIKIKKGNHLFFYISHLQKTIVAFAIIKRISTLLPKDIMKQVGKTQMTIDEFNAYTLNRENKALLFIELNEIIDFSNPIKINKSVSMAGLYLKKSEIETILKKP